MLRLFRLTQMAKLERCYYVISLTGTDRGLCIRTLLPLAEFGIPSGATWKGTVATSGTA